MTESHPDISFEAEQLELSPEEKSLERCQAWLMGQFDIPTLIATPEPAHAAGMLQHVVLGESVLKGFLSTLEEAEFSSSAQACLRASELSSALSRLYLWEGLPAPVRAALRPRDMNHLDTLKEKAIAAGLRPGAEVGFDLERLTSISFPQTPGGHIRLGIGTGWERFGKHAKKRRFSSLHMLKDVFETPFEACKWGLMDRGGVIAHGDYEVGAYCVAERAERGFLDATWSFPNADKALSAFTKICDRVPPLFAEYIPQAHLVIAALSGSGGRLGRRAPKKIGQAGIRLVYRGSILKARLKLAKASFIAELAGGVMRRTGPHQSDGARRCIILAAGAVEIDTELSVSWHELEALVTTQTKMLAVTARDNPVFLGAMPVLAPRIRVIRGRAPVIDYGVICPRDLKDPLAQWAEVTECTRAIAAGFAEGEDAIMPGHDPSMPPEIGE